MGRFPLSIPKSGQDQIKWAKSHGAELADHEADDLDVVITVL